VKYFLLKTCIKVEENTKSIRYIRYADIDRIYSNSYFNKNNPTQILRNLICSLYNGKDIVLGNGAIPNSSQVINEIVEAIDKFYNTVTTESI